MLSLAGSFLVAKPVLEDPNFVQTVVLLLRHGSEGAFGLVVNRPAEIEALPFTVFTGGPCPAPGLIMLHGEPQWATPPGVEDPDPSTVVAPGIFVGNADCMSRVGDGPCEEPRFRMFAGYSGWGPDQLERELASGAWIIAPATGELLFDTAPDALWDRLSPPATPKPSLN